MNYKQFENLQTRKTISAYGGVGSILETRDGAILVNDFDKWPFFQKLNGNFQEEHIIDDLRFKNRLMKYFSQLKHLIRVPINDLDDGNFSNEQYTLLSGRYFPEWFYCPSCKKFDKLSNWKINWTNSVRLEDKTLLYPPKCYKCYINTQNEGKNRGKKIDLEQIRFILTSPSGDIVDIPWDRWAFAKSNKKEADIDNPAIEADTDEEKRFYLSDFIPDKDIEYELKTLDKLSDLSGILVIAKKDGSQIAKNTLSGLFNLRVPKQEIFPNSYSKELFKPVIRTSNSIYYPNILSSIYIPPKYKISEETIRIIKESYEDGNTAEAIFKELKRNHKSIIIDIEEIISLIETRFNLDNIDIVKSETEYRLDEYLFILAKDKDNVEDKLIFEKIDPSLYNFVGINSIYRLDKIKLTTVQTSYTRQEPIDKDFYLLDDSEIEFTTANIKKKYTSKHDLRTYFLPAVESYGEGILFVFDSVRLKDWLSNHEKVIKRGSIIKENHKESDSTINRNKNITPEFIAIHTFSHLIIKELEFLCGYPSTSIQERLYYDDCKMYGVLIYTIAGTEGSYGGLTSICKSEKIGNLIHSSLNRAKDCASDPICYNSSGQGVGNLNLAACYSCALLPETSCEEFNCFLDRAILIDKDFGFFKQRF